MKLLQNPLVTGALSLLAAGVVIYQCKPFLQRAHPGASHSHLKSPLTVSPVQQSQAAVPRSTNDKVSSAAPDRTQDSGRSPRIDGSWLAARFPAWVAAPKRDPFLLLGGAKKQDNLQPETASPITKWKLKGIWNQTGMRVAAINAGVYGVGDQIEGYKVTRIESDEVWFQGPLGDERLAFQTKGRLSPLPSANRSSARLSSTVRSPVVPRPN